MRALLCLPVLVLALAAALQSQFHLPGISGNSAPKPDAPPKTKAASPASTTPAAETAPAAPKRFDYYTLSVSWHAGKIAVKGLAPQMNQGPNPEYCGSVKPASKGAMSIVVSIMPDRNAVQQEWMKHGSCTGFAAAEYFNTIRFTRSLVQIPVQLTSPDVDTPAAAPKLIEAWFASANSSFPSGAFRVSEADVRAAATAEAEVEVCFDLRLKPRACPTGSK